MSFLGGLLGGGQEMAKMNLINPVTQANATASMDANLEQMKQQQALLNQLAMQNGIGNQTNVYNQQQMVANQLADQAAGNGPNPAMAQLANSTGANVANQAALMAGQRGASANPGLIARQAAMQGAATQQQAAGQGAALQAQQQLQALQQLQQQQVNMGNLATQQTGQQINQQNTNQGAAANNQNSLFNQANAQNQTSLAKAKMENEINAANAKNKGAAIGGLLGGAASIFGGPLAGMAVNALMSSGGSGGGSGGGGNVGGIGDDSQGAGMLNSVTPFANGGQVPGGPSSRVGQHFAGLAMQSGGAVPGQAMVPGNSIQNDTVPAMLSPGEVVIPKSVMESKNPQKGAADFVAALMRKNGRKS